VERDQQVSAARADVQNATGRQSIGRGEDVIAPDLKERVWTSGRLAIAVCIVAKPGGKLRGPDLSGVGLHGESAGRLEKPPPTVGEAHDVSVGEAGDDFVEGSLVDVGVGEPR
jgi:hypothetical protein